MRNRLGATLSAMTPSERTIIGLPPRLVAYVGVVVASAAGVLAVSADRLVVEPPRLSTGIGMVLFLAFGLIAELHPVPLDDKGSQVSLGFVFNIAALLIFGWAAAIPIAALSIFVPMLIQGNPTIKAALNGSAYALAAAAASIPRLSGLVHSHDVLRMSIYAFAAGLIFVLVNVGLVAGAISIAQSVSYRETLFSILEYSGPALSIMGFLAALAANLWTIKPALLLLLAGPLFALSLYQRTALRSRMALHDALTDNLTGLGNHRAYQASLRERIAHAKHDHTEFSLCIVDVDDFKRINDTYGHQVGDDVLVALAEILGIARDGDAFRCGGDEFALMFAGDAAAAFERITEVQDAVAGLGLTPVTISVGIASYPEPGGRRRRAPAHGRRRAVLVEAPRQKPLLRLQPEGRAHPLREGPRVGDGADGAAACGEEHRALRRRKGLLQRRTTPRPCRPSRPRLRPRWAWMRTWSTSSRSPACCTTSARSASPTRSCRRRAR